ncbi:hypothetical protein CBL_05543 [Carabus blaptoides fortunei]
MSCHSPLSDDKNPHISAFFEEPSVNFEEIKRTFPLLKRRLYAHFQALDSSLNPRERTGSIISHNIVSERQHVLSRILRYNQRKLVPATGGRFSWSATGVKSTCGVLPPPLLLLLLNE